LRRHEIKLFKTEYAVAAGILLCLITFEGYAAEDKAGINISQPVRRLLAAEMNRVQNGINNLAVAMSAGRWEDLTETSRQMANGYIMKQKLTKRQMNEFYRSLPPGYKEIDMEFREAAGKLSDGAEKEDMKLVNSMFCKLNETCVKCHSTYAKKRFPGFKQKTP
jgi:hypothetical protein